MSNTASTGGRKQRVAAGQPSAMLPSITASVQRRMLVAPEPSSSIRRPGVATTTSGASLSALTICHLPVERVPSSTAAQSDHGEREQEVSFGVASGAGSSATSHPSSTHPSLPRCLSPGFLSLSPSPPNTAQARMLNTLPNFCACRKICSASSRVGVSTRATGPSPARMCGCT